jgi:hypothetical protein
MNEQGKVILVSHTDCEGAQRAVDIIHGGLPAPSSASSSGCSASSIRSC